MNKILVGVGLVALIAVGTLGVLELGESDDRRVGAIGPLEKPVALSWRGSWTGETKYEAGEVVSYEGASYVAEAATGGEPPSEKEGPWALLAATALQGAAGEFSGTFTSPNGTYSLTVADTGIVLSGGTREVIKLTNAGIELETGGSLIVRAGNEVVVDSGAATRLKAGSTMGVEAGASASVRGSIVRLGCFSGGKPVARQSDGVQTGPQGTLSPITQGSPTVLAC